MKKYALLLFFLSGLLTLSYAQHKTVMLVLGSDNKDILQERIQIANRLFKSRPFEAIIVSGGCAAHGSVICEASLMKELLIGYGVDAAIIHKEENAKTTVQNYVFSRKLQDHLGNRIIQPGDTVYVVSNHWHAISVAARLQKYDSVIAKFHIEGALEPKATDKLDYVGIFNTEADNLTFIRKGIWMTPNAVWQQGETQYYLMDDQIYSSNAANSEVQWQASAAYFPFLNSQPALLDPCFIDAGKVFYLWNSKQLFEVQKAKPQQGKLIQWDQLIRNLPKNWQAQIKVGFIHNGKLFLFADSALFIASKRGKYFEVEQETSADQYFKNWPFGWGKGNVSAAQLLPDSNQVRLFRNQEQLTLDLTKKEVSEVKPLKLKWIAN